MSKELKLQNKTPKITGTFKVCPIPYKYDTYTGCTFGCKYCFARDIVQFARKTHKNENVNFDKFEYLIGSNPISFKKWVDNTLNKDSIVAERVAFKERIPLKIGVTADPFPYIERENKITYESLKILNDIDYPVQISTKNPQILLEYIDDFIVDGRIPNWALSVTIITLDDNIRRQVEPFAPTIQSRLNAIKKITNKGIKVTVRIQPVIYPYINTIYKELIKSLYEVGVSGVIVEGLKLKMAMCLEEQKIYQEMSKCLGYDIRSWYKENGRIDGGDYIIKNEDKLDYINKIKYECDKYSICLYVGDNDCKKYSCDEECCGTKHLRNHKVIQDSDLLLNCKISGSRAKKNIGKTIGEVINYGIK